METYFLKYLSISKINLRFSCMVEFVLESWKSLSWCIEQDLQSYKNQEKIQAFSLSWTRSARIFWKSIARLWFVLSVRAGKHIGESPGKFDKLFTSDASPLISWGLWQFIDTCRILKILLWNLSAEILKDEIQNH